jgi:hypothetical protein
MEFWFVGWVLKYLKCSKISKDLLLILWRDNVLHAVLDVFPYIQKFVRHSNSFKSNIIYSSWNVLGTFSVRNGSMQNYKKRTKSIINYGQQTWNRNHDPTFCNIIPSFSSITFNKSHPNLI